MLYKRKIKSLNVAEIWFEVPDDFSPKKYAFCNYNSMINPPALKKGERCLFKQDIYTLVTDLTEPEEAIFLRFDSDVRNKIRRAKKDGTVCQFYTSEDLCTDDTLLRKFDKAYAEMLQQKGMRLISIKNSMEQYAKEGALFLSVCKIGDEIVAYHSFVAGDKIARGLYSVSTFRSCSDTAERSAIGRANRLLHYEDMLYFKKLGFNLLDWGGYSSDPELTSINSFKKGFGGELVNRYFVTTTTKWWVSVLFMIRNIIRGGK